MAEHKRRTNLTQGSLARKLETQRKEEMYESVQSNPVIREIRLKRERKEKKLGMVAKVLVLFTLALLVIFRYARITELGYEYNKYNDQYENVKAENERLNVEIEKSINLAHIREVAEGKLKMGKPDAYQTVPIEVKRLDVTELSESEQKEEKGLLSSIYDWFKGILGFME